MWRVLTSTFVALTFFSTAAAAQQPCITDTDRVVSELYRHILERAPDAAADHWKQQLASGNMTVREVVRSLVLSQEHMQQFGQREAGEASPYYRAVGRLYRHILARQPDEQGQRAHAQMAQQRGLDAVVDSLITSQEYDQKFGDYGVPGSGGVVYCAPDRVSSAQQAPGAVTQYRFSGMDRNNDGVVSRAEWRGSAQSFRVHDWNNDGVLSEAELLHDEARRGRTIDDERFDRGERFEYLDTNNNGRIEWREWHMSRAAFNRLDANDDGVLSRAEVQGEFTGFGAVATTGGTVIVDANERWTDTGIRVQAGDTIAFDADGRIRLSANPNDFAAPSGSVKDRRAPNAPLPNAPAGGLIARIDNSEPVYVGEGRTLRAPVSGRLYLSVNDDHLADNEGQYRVIVNVR